MATILKEAENLVSSGYEDTYRILRLSENYTRYSLNELIVRFSESQVTFSRLDDTESDYDEDGDPVRRQPSKNYVLNAAEADAFVEAWTGYKADRAAALKAEEERKAGVLTEANKLAEELGLEITADEDVYDGNQHFRIKHPHRHVSRTYAYTVDGLLEIVKEFQTEMAEEKQTIAEAKEVMKRVAELSGDTCSITSQKPAYNGYYNMTIVGKFSHWTTSQLRADQILTRFKNLLAELEREQAQTESARS